MSDRGARDMGARRGRDEMIEEEKKGRWWWWWGGGRKWNEVKVFLFQFFHSHSQIITPFLVFCIFIPRSQFLFPGYHSYSQFSIPSSNFPVSNREQPGFRPNGEGREGREGDGGEWEYGNEE